MLTNASYIIPGEHCENIQRLNEENKSFEIMPFPLEELGNKLYCYEDRNGEKSVFNGLHSECLVLEGYSPKSFSLEGNCESVVVIFSGSVWDAVNEEILYETRILELPFYEKTNNWLNLEPTISVNNVNTMTTLFNKLVRAAENGEELNNITRGMLLLGIS